MFANEPDDLCSGDLRLFSFGILKSENETEGFQIYLFQVIILDADLLLHTDIRELWDYFRHFSSEEVS